MSNEIRLAELEAKFADLILDNEPIGSTQLVKLAERELNWKKATMYTVLRKLCERGIFNNEYAVVTSILKKDEFYAKHSQNYVDETFEGSLPKFLTAFVSGRKLTAKQAEEAKRLIEAHIDEDDDN